MKSPRPSVRRHSATIGLSDRSVRRILHKDLNFNPHKTAIGQDLSDRDMANRRIFSGQLLEMLNDDIIPYPTAFPYGNGMVLHFYQQQESSTTKTVHKVINKGLKTYV